jgi:UDP-N-acetylmuramate dehydrogenase
MTLAAPSHPRAPQPFDDLGDIVELDIPMARHTWFRIGGPAKYFIRPRSVEELAEVARRCEEFDIPVYVLGLGANVLVSDEGIPGAVIRLSDLFWRQVHIRRDEAAGTAHLTAHAGADLQKLVLHTTREGLAGIECMAGIPGTVGGGVRMNAGGKFGDFGANVTRVTVMDPGGNVVERTRDDLIFEYRRTNIVAPYILSAELELDLDDPSVCMQRTKEVWMYKRGTQPLNTKSAGCMFKNPRGISAGSLIDKSGLKGLRVGNAEVSSKHANFIIAHPGCTAEDIRNLVAELIEKVEAKHGVRLETEVQMWP